MKSSWWPKRHVFLLRDLYCSDSVTWFKCSVFFYFP